MGRREYSHPRIGSWGGSPRWTKDPRTAPPCIFPDCPCRATRQPWIEVSYMRGDDERSGPVCKEHSEQPPRILLQVTAAWKAVQRAKQDAARQRKLNNSGLSAACTKLADTNLKGQPT